MADSPPPASTDPSHACRGCGDPGSIDGFLSLGEMPLGNAFIPPSEIAGEVRYPLEMGVCRSCFLVQVVDPAPVAALEKVYRNYSYVPTGKTLEDHYDAFAADVLRTIDPAPGSLFVDIGSNDGLFLSKLRRHRPDARVVGVEPSTRPADLARARAITTVQGFFDAATAGAVRSQFGPAHVLSATQVFQHLREPHRFLELADSLLEPGGVLVLEGRAYFPDVDEKVSFDTFYHELLFCFTLHSLSRLLERSGFGIFHAEHQEIYGGSLRVFAQRKDGGRPVDPSVPRLLAREREQGVADVATYVAFGRKVEGVRQQVVRLVRDLRKGGERIVGYGAPSTGNTLLCYCDLDQKVLDYIVDDNPLKQGLVTPGTHLSIENSAEITKRPPAYILVIAWRLQEEIVAKLRPLRDQGLRGILIPLPHPEVLT
jgi:SAM-dependent methyltransferase